MPTDADPAQQLEELRRVLIKPDEVVAQISPQKLDQLRLELLTAELLVERLSPHLAAILEEQVSHSPDAFARGIAPVIGEAIRRQVYQSREDIVDALYPVVGQMINRAVGEALRGLARNVDSRVRHSLRLPGTQRPADRLGLSEAEYQLRAVLPFSVQEVFLIQHETGLLICHVSGGEAQPDRDLVSGMLTAIRDFARDAFGKLDTGELGAIEYESRRILLEAGSAAYLAVVVDGVDPVGFREELRDLLVVLHQGNYERLLGFDGSDTALVEQARISLKTLLRTHAALPAPQPEPPQPKSALQPEPAATSRSERRRLSFPQRLIMGAVILFSLAPLLACGWWFWQVEARLAALGAAPTPVGLLESQKTSVIAAVEATSVPPTATAVPDTATPLRSPTLVPTLVPAFTPVPPAPPTAILPAPEVTAPAPVLGEMVGNVFLRSGATFEGQRSTIIAPLGARVEILEQSGDWSRIRVLLDDRAGVQAIGWVLSKWIRMPLTD